MNSTSAERGGVRGLTKRSGCGKSPHPLASLATSPRKRKEVTLRPYRWLLRRLRGLLRQIDRAPAADVVEMGVEEAPGRALAELAQRLEMLVVGLERAARAEPFVDILHHDAMQPQPPELARPRSPPQPALVDQPVDELDSAQLGKERGVEADLIRPAHDHGRARRHLPALARI